MHIAVAGAGPTGLYLAVALARRGHAVRVVDRDPGPRPDGAWARAGVMQFHHPHFFRGQVLAALDAEMPDVLDLLVVAGADPATLPDGRPMGLRCRRLTFERVLRAVAFAEPGVTPVRGHVDAVTGRRGRADGLRVDGRVLDADLVLDASGRAGRFGRDLRAPAEGGECGQAYVSRQYRLRPGAEPGPITGPVVASAEYPGYLATVFPHDNGVFATVIMRAAGDRQLAGLRHPAAYESATRAIPLLAAWTDPARAEPITDVLPGGRLLNTYRGQLAADGTLPLPGHIAVGDAVCTTNPSAGRGTALALMQARRLLVLLDEESDLAAVALAFDDWCHERIRPWFADHVDCDAQLARRWAGHDIDLGRRLPPDLIGAAAQVDPSMMSAIGPYQSMQALPSSLDAVEPRARAIYASGWRPPVPDGPSRDELADLVTRRARVAA